MDQRNIANVGAFRKPNVEMKYLPKLEKGRPLVICIN